MEVEGIIRLFKELMTRSIHDLELSHFDMFNSKGALKKYEKILMKLLNGEVVKKQKGKPYEIKEVESIIFKIKSEYISNHNFFYSSWCKELCGYIDLDYEFLIDNLRKRNLLKKEMILNVDESNVEN